MATFAERLLELRTSHDLSQEALAEFLGVTRASVSNYENGKGEPKYSDLIKLAKRFNVTTDYLLGIEGAQKHFFDHYNEKSEEATRMNTFLEETEALIRAKGNVTEDKLSSVRQFMEFVFRRDEEQRKRS